VVGVTLPLLSYGGSSVVAVFFALGLAANVSRRRFVN
jgi:rod shape determining protein RodA